MYTLSLEPLRFVVIFASLSYHVKTEISNEEFSIIENTGCISYYAKEVGVRSAAFCRFLCGRKEDCAGVGIENEEQKINCYFFSTNKSESVDLNPTLGMQHWVKGNIL